MKFKFLFLFKKFHTVRIPIRNHTELLVVNYFPEKNHPALSKQLKNVPIKFSISKTFRFVKITLKVVNIKLPIGEFPIHNIHTTSIIFLKKNSKENSV